MYSISKETATIKTRDGVNLVADIYRPQTTEKLPILLMRQPYGRAIASTVVYAHPRWYAQQGYIVVIQDVRGRGDSGGEFELFSHEIADGEDTLQWLSNLNGSTGEVGMYGFSYQGMTQLYCAISGGGALKTICPAMVAYDLYSDWAYENGAFCRELNLAWALQLSAETARLKQDLHAYSILYFASRNLPDRYIPSQVEEVLRKYCPSNFYYQWLKHSENDDYWQQLSPSNYFENVDLPMLHIGGWFDNYLRGTMNLYQKMTKKSHFQQSLIIGPWAHLPWGNKRGSQFYSTNANNDINEIQIQWFDYYLKGKKNTDLIPKNIKLFVMGANKYIFAEKFDGQNNINFYLNSTGLANIRDDDGKLINDNIENIENSEDTIVNDFWRPSPSLGGHYSSNAGSFERRELNNRSDILTYTSAPFTTDLTIMGDVEIELYVICERETFDINAVLSEVREDDTIYNFTQGYKRVKNHQQTSTKVTFKLQPTCYEIKRGRALNLSISSSAFPAFNLNQGNPHLSDNFDLDNQTLTLTVLSGKNYPSRLKVDGVR
ncbi:MAG: CocE/NonD family hydrolase [Cyanobacterium sp. T60_A2020_053]|nr:CocE/NonD family hydrolase [Cyanobacterium sp. T60_A2020_053]